LTNLPGVGEKMADVLRAHKISDITSLSESDEATLSALPLIGAKTATRLIHSAREYLGSLEKN